MKDVTRIKNKDFGIRQPLYHTHLLIFIIPFNFHFSTRTDLSYHVTVNHKPAKQHSAVIKTH